MKILRIYGHILKDALPQETVVANLVRRILKIIREEFDLLEAKVNADLLSYYAIDKCFSIFFLLKVHHLIDDSQATLSLHKLVTQTSECDVSIDYTKPRSGLKEAILDHLQEIENELEISWESICAQAEQHVHSTEVILTLSHSKNTEHFLKKAIEKRQSLTIIIAECAPACRVYMP